MPKNPISAAGGPMPATGHDDAELLAMCARLAILRAEEKAAAEALEAAELRSAPPEPPAAILRTEEDAKMKLFIGLGVGDPYVENEIAAIKVLYRSLGGQPLARQDAARIWRRCKAILEAWAHWRQGVEADEARSGLKAAEAAYHAACQASDRLERAMTFMPAHTLDGVRAKARTAMSHVSDLAAVEDSLTEHMHLFGPDNQTGMLAILRDLVTMGEARAD